MKLTRARTYAVAAMVILIAGALAPVAQAFSAYGNGTADNPFRIATCSELKEINNNLSAYYVLVSNIDCTGGTFSPLAAGGTAFSGTLNGQDHSITNIELVTGGLFGETNGATIENLTLGSGSIIDSGSNTLGSFVGTATGTTLQNVHSSLTITEQQQYTDIGGLIGMVDTSTTISKSSFTGSITADNPDDQYIGGLVGAVQDSTDTISDSYSTGAITLTPNPTLVDVGGIIGRQENGLVQNVYSNDTISGLGGATYTGAGGLIGRIDGGNFSNSFSSSTLSGTIGANSYEGAAFGLNYATTNNDYFDSYLAGTGTCSGINDGSGSCSAENNSNASPSYFQDNDTNGPFSGWDFTNNWTETATYPTLRNIAGFAATAGIPNNGDANGDGTLDSYQANIASIEASDNTWSTVEVPSTSACTIDNTSSISTAAAPAESSYAPEVNFDSFSIYCGTTGASVPVTIIYDKLYNTAGTMVREYNSQTHAYTTIAGATFGTVTVGGVAKTTVTYNVTDGGPYDEDGVANGLIVDPVAIAQPVAATSLTDTGVDIGVTSILAVTFIALSFAVRRVPKRM